MRHHYVPQWYQNGFVAGTHPNNKLYYLNLKPDNIVDASGRIRQHSGMRRYGTPSCFYEEDLYTTRFGKWESSEIEEKFFGDIDNKGKDAIAYFQNFEHPNANRRAYQDMILYLSVQKLRTPKGLEYLGRQLKEKDKNHLLFAMQELQRVYHAFWTESVWAIADASQSRVKLILSDHPVSVYNMASNFSETSWCREREDPEIWQSGTHTLFPLNQNKILILTNQSWVRNPYGDPAKLHPNPNPMRDAIFNFTEIQTGRTLSEADVTKINYIIKKRAFRYIASSEKEWLYPENHIPTQNWRKFGKEYLLMPDPRSVKFTNEIGIGYSDGSTRVFDVYGRRPSDSDYQGRSKNENEWKTFKAFQREYARIFGPKRRGVTFDSLAEESPGIYQP